MTSWWQRQESFLSLNVAGWLSCTSKRVQHAIPAEVGRSKTVILNFLKDPESYGPKIQVLDPKKSSPALSRKIRRAVREDTGRSSTQIKALTDADCSPITIRRHLREKDFKNKTIFKGHVSSHATNLPVWNLQGSTKHGTLKGGRKFYSLMRKN